MPTNLSRLKTVPILVRGPKIPSKVWETNVGTWSIVISETIFANDNTWLPPHLKNGHMGASICLYLTLYGIYEKLQAKKFSDTFFDTLG